jgi:hypothetical protein
MSPSTGCAGIEAPCDSNGKRIESSVAQANVVDEAAPSSESQASIDAS